MTREQLVDGIDVAGGPRWPDGRTPHARGEGRDERAGRASGATCTIRLGRRHARRR